MRNSDDFRAVTRSGVRVGRPTLVVHAGRVADRDLVRIGFVVSKQVGNAVTRNRVKRRLRHLATAQLAGTPAGVDLVVRALPRAATAPAEVPADLVSAWSRAVAKAGSRVQARS